MLDDDHEVDQLERRPVAGLQAVQHQRHRRLRALEVEAAALQLLDLRQHLLHFFLAGVQAELLRLVDQVAAARQLAHQHPLFVADQGRVNVLVAVLDLHDGRDVDAALVRERAGAHERLARVGGQVGRLGHEARQLGQPAQLVVLQAA